MKKAEYLLAGLCAVFFIVSREGRCLAIDAVTEAKNTRWHCSDKTGTATFLGGEKPETADLVLTKSKVMGQTLTVISDAQYIVLSSGDAPHIVFKIPENHDGTTTKIMMTSGDQPTLFINDKEQVQLQGKWIQIATASEPTMTLEMGTNSFAKVKFDAPTPVVAAAPPPKPPVVADVGGSQELLHPVSPTQLLNVCRAFDQGINRKCVSCDGSGKIHVQVQTGTQQQGIYSVPTYRTDEKKCDKCNGTGIDRSKDDVLIKLSGTMVKDLAAVRKDDEKTQKALSDAYNEITKDMIGDQRTWATLTKDGRSILALASPRTGTTVVALVEVKKSVPRDNDHRRFLVRVIGTDKEVYVDDPVLADDMKSGHALMGGMVDEPAISGNNGQKTTVLRGGFLIAPQVSHDWWWWYKDQ